MPRGQRGFHALAGKHAPRGHAHSQDGWLGVFRQTEVLFRPIEAKPRKCEAQRLIGLGEGIGGYRKKLREVAPHADGLRTLTRKKKSEFGVHFRGDCIPPRGGVTRRSGAGLTTVPGPDPSIPATTRAVPSWLLRKFSSSGSCRSDRRRSRSEERRVGKECRSRWSP